jgi:hypothetical protein
MSRLCRSVVVVMTALLMTSGCVVDYLIAPGCKRGEACTSSTSAGSSSESEVSDAESGSSSEEHESESGEDAGEDTTQSEDAGAE